MINFNFINWIFANLIFGQGNIILLEKKLINKINIGQTI